MNTEMENWKELYFQKKGRTYENHVNKFINYLKNVAQKANTPNNIKLEDVSDCIGYYVKKRSINSVSSMELHLESLKSFYDFLLKEGKSRHIFSQIDYEDYKKFLTEKYQLTSREERGTFSLETIKDILTKLDGYLQCDSITSQEYSKYLRLAILNLFIKFTLIAPAKRNVICSIKYNDFSENFRSININDIEISIPNSLRHDLIKILDIMKCNNNEIKSDDNLFIYIGGNKFDPESLNRWFCSFIKEFKILGVLDVNDKTTTFPTENIINTVICNLVKNKANLSYISKISGVKISTLETKYYKDIFSDNLQQPSVSESINWEISKNGYYSYI
ncbi:site-specific integrase [Clostridium sp.]|jgi:hypothetical protein|uniref:site-specific integrase n=1 Tax=Clostridium sp. TaxID=1506 RepID=UPI0025848B9D|nr:site-specific integrase [Clostridium sp.]MDF2503071.1 hypothetical protein [Clostridium sp.]